MEFRHYSVLLRETIEQLHIKPDGIYVDGTLGGGGHACEVLKRLGPKGRLIGIDQDADAIKAAAKRLEPMKERVIIVRDNYRNIQRALESLTISKVAGTYLHLGLSSSHLHTAQPPLPHR